MISRLMDLVLLLAEMHENKERSHKDMGNELTLKGYTTEEIDQALSWISSNKVVSNDNYPDISKSGGQRVLTSWERICLEAESQRYLLRLLNLGIIDHQQLERIMVRIAPNSMEKTDLDDVKTITCSVIFNAFPYDLEDDEFKEFEEIRDFN
jgi:uncharacterized protein Smg (DUF494 family)